MRMRNSPSERTAAQPVRAKSHVCAPPITRKVESPVGLLRTRYQSRGLVLAFGAGISEGCGLPNWPELLRRVGERALPKPNGRDLVQQLIDAGTTRPTRSAPFSPKANTSTSSINPTAFSITRSSTCCVSTPACSLDCP